MRKTTDKKGHGLLGGVIVTVLVVGVVLLMLAALFQAFGPVLPLLGELGAAFGMVLVYAGIILAVGIGVVVALIQRWKEIKGGEEDEAKKLLKKASWSFDVSEQRDRVILAILHIHCFYPEEAAELLDVYSKDKNNPFINIYDMEKIRKNKENFPQCGNT